MLNTSAYVYWPFVLRHFISPFISWIAWALGSLSLEFCILDISPLPDIYWQRFLCLQQTVPSLCCWCSFPEKKLFRSTQYISSSDYFFVIGVHSSQTCRYLSSSNFSPTFPDLIFLHEDIHECRRSFPLLGFSLDSSIFPNFNRDFYFFCYMYFYEAVVHETVFLVPFLAGSPQVYRRATGVYTWTSIAAI